MLKETMAEGGDFMLLGIKFELYGIGTSGGECYRGWLGFDEDRGHSRYVVEITMDGKVFAYDTDKPDGSPDHLLYDGERSDTAFDPEVVIKACKRVAHRGNFELPDSAALTITDV